MNQLVSDLQVIKRFEQDMRGVFTLSDIKAMFPSDYSMAFYRRLARLEDSKLIRRFAQGLYVTEKFDIAVVSQKLCPVSYVSFETALAKHLVIGTKPLNMIRAVKIGKKREYKFEGFSVVHLGVSRHLYFGFENTGGINFATKEKAVLDTLYFYCKGLTFYFDIYSDMNLELIDRKILNGALARYKNPRFVRFVKNFFKERCL